MVFHTAAFAQQPKNDDPANEDAQGPKDASDAKATSDAKAKGDAKTAAENAPAAAPGAESKEPQQLPPGYAPPPGYRNAPPPPPTYPQPPSEEPYYQGPYHHGYYYGPPPAPYPYAPPRYYRRYPPPPPPARLYPEPIEYRSFFFGVGLGVGGVGVFPDQAGASNASRVGLGYNFRLGFGVAPRWSLVLAIDGAGAYFDNVSISETVFSIGPQFFITRKLYARLGIGAAGRTYDYSDQVDAAGNFYYGGASSDSGMGGVGAVGFEFMQSYHVSLALEANGTVGYYPNHDVLSTFGINFIFNLF